MKSFDIYEHPTLGYKVVKRGFCWPAFFFTVIWAFVKKMWSHGWMIIGVFLFLVLIETMFEEEGSEGGVLLMLVLEVGFTILIGFKGNDWRRSNLAKRGFQFTRNVTAQTPDAALAQARVLSTGDMS